MRQEKTYWEKVAETRWGRYTSEIEKEIILNGSVLANPPEFALEVGCEGGRWSKMLRDAGWKMICTDVNQESLNACKEKIPDAECIKVNPTDVTLPVDSNTVKLLLCIEVPPVINEDWFINEADRVLKKEGIAVLVFWNILSLRGLFIKLKTVFRKINRDELVFYKRRYYEQKKIYKRMGFEIIKEVGYCWFPFSRNSNSKLIPFFVYIEKFLGLRKITFFSPWVVTIFKRK
jgi:ubiquinone/menaquinone biosynthesis C-methylase UbiE